MPDSEWIYVVYLVYVVYLDRKRQIHQMYQNYQMPLVPSRRRTANVDSCTGMRVALGWVLDGFAPVGRFGGAL